MYGSITSTILQILCFLSKDSAPPKISSIGGIAHICLNNPNSLQFLWFGVCIEFSLALIYHTMPSTSLQSEDRFGANHAPAPVSSTPTPSSNTTGPELVLTQNMKLQIISDEIIFDWEESGKEQL